MKIEEFVTGNRKKCYEYGGDAVKALPVFCSLSQASGAASLQGIRRVDSDGEHWRDSAFAGASRPA